MATEDHDFEEINHFKTQNHIYSIDGKSGGAVGRIKVEKNNFIEEFEKEFNIQIPDDQAEKIQTVGHAIAYIEEVIK